MFFDMKRGGGGNNNNSLRPPTSTSTRAEMVGPSDLSDILSGIKMKNGGDTKPKLNSNSFFDVENTVSDKQMNTNTAADSTISISDLKEMAASSSGMSDQNQPMRSRRRPKSDRAISLNI
jgi:hypothetical protein